MSITPGADISKPVELERSESHHVRQVLRLAVGDVVELLDGCGGRYHGSIDTIGATVSVRVIDVAYEIPATPSLWLYQGELKQAKTDELVEKCVELGVTRFIPVTCARTQGRRDGRRLQKRWKRRENIVRGACKQCGRATFMEVAEEGDFATLISGSGDHGIIRIMFYEGARAAFDATLIAGTGTRRICLLTGPEGGIYRPGSGTGPGRRLAGGRAGGCCGACRNGGGGGNHYRPTSTGTIIVPDAI